jgi:hypothetical protein
MFKKNINKKPSGRDLIKLPKPVKEGRVALLVFLCVATITLTSCAEYEWSEDDVYTFEEIKTGAPEQVAQAPSTPSKGAEERVNEPPVEAAVTTPIETPQPIPQEELRKPAAKLASAHQEQCNYEVAHVDLSVKGARLLETINDYFPSGAFELAKAGKVKDQMISAYEDGTVDVFLHCKKTHLNNLYTDQQFQRVKATSLSQINNIKKLIVPDKKLAPILAGISNNKRAQFINRFKEHALQDNRFFSSKHERLPYTMREIKGLFKVDNSSDGVRLNIPETVETVFGVIELGVLAVDGTKLALNPRSFSMPPGQHKLQVMCVFTAPYMAPIDSFYEVSDVVFSPYGKGNYTIFADMDPDNFNCDWAKQFPV